MDGAGLRAVCILTELYFPDERPSSGVITALGGALSALGIRVHVVCGPHLSKLPGGSAKYVHEGVEVLRLWSTRFSPLGFWGKLINQLTFSLSVGFYLLGKFRDKTPLVVLTSPPLMVPVVAKICWLTGRKYILLVFDVYPETAIKTGLISSWGPIACIWRLANRFVYRGAAKIIVISRLMEEHFMSRLRNNNPQKLHYLPIWTDEARILAYGPARGEFRRLWGLSRSFVALYAGNMGRAHDFEAFLQAAQRLGDRPEIAFVFVGDGFKKAWLKDEIARRKLTNCHLYDYVARTDFPELLASADVGLVSLALGHEGLSVPSKVFSLMAAGLPVVAAMADNSEVARILSENECGLCVSPQDGPALAEAILKLWQDHTLHDRMGKNGQEIIRRKYNVKSAAQGLAGFIKQVDPNRVAIN